MKKSQESTSLPIEVDNAKRDFFSDLGSGSLANDDGPGLPVTATMTVYLTHRRAGPRGDAHPP